MAERKLFAYSDGGARGNPGPAAIGVVLCDSEKEVILEFKQAIGETTNNTAEYEAMIKALELAAEKGAESVECFSDSELLVKQLNGEYKVKKKHLRELFKELKRKEEAFKEVAYKNVRRTDPLIQEADALVNEALDAE